MLKWEGLERSVLKWEGLMRVLICPSLVTSFTCTHRSRGAWSAASIGACVHTNKK